MPLIPAVVSCAVALTLHNLEEFFGLPGWAGRHDFWSAKDARYTVRFRGFPLAGTFAVIA